MTIDELMARLQALFPWRSAGELELAAADYRAVLGQHAGHRLAAAWQATVASWRERRRPLPGDIAAHVVVPRIGGSLGAAASEQTGSILDDAKRRKLRLVEDWWRDHSEWVDEAIRRQGFGADDAAAFRGHVGQVVGERAWVAAQHQARGRAHHVVISESDLQSAIDRTTSQRSTAGEYRSTRQVTGGQDIGTAMQRLTGRGPAPRHVERTMGERLASVGLDPEQLGAPR